MAGKADLGRIKGNVAKMVSMNAPESDIDAYIGEEGVSIDDVRNYKLDSDKGNVVKEVASKALEIASNPVKSMLTKEGMGVGQGAIQGATMGYGMPLLRNIPGSEEVAQPTLKENIVGNVLGAAGTAGMGAALGAGNVISKLPAVAKAALPFAFGAAQNTRDDKVAKLNDPMRLVGGALGASGQIAGLAAKGVRHIIKPDAVNALIRGIKPGTNNSKFKASAGVALKEIQKRSTTPVETVEDFVAASKEAKGSLWKEIQEKLDDAESKMVKEVVEVRKNVPMSSVKLYDATGRDLTTVMKEVTENKEVLKNGIKGKSIGDAIEGSIDSYTQDLEKGTANEIRAMANDWRELNITVADAEEKLQRINADITNYFRSAPRDQHIKGSKPYVAAKLAERLALKDALDAKVNSLSGKGMAELKKSYGALMNVQDEAFKRINVADRANPLSLQEAVHKVLGVTKLLGGDIVGGVVEISGSSAVKKLNSSNHLVSSAVKNFGKKRTPLTEIGSTVGVGIGGMIERNMR